MAVESGMSFMGMLLVLLTGGGMGPMLGLPPGPRDESLLRCPPAQTVVYAEWAQRGSGIAGAPGLEGLLGDHEIQEFLDKAETAILEAITRETEDGSPEQQILAESAPRLVKAFLKQPGCFYLSYNEDNVIALDSPPATAMSALHGLRFSLIINGGKQADQIDADLRKVLQLLEGQEPETLDRHALPIPLPGIPVLVHRHKSYLILSVGDGSLDGAIAGLDGKSNGLADDDRFKAGMRRVLMPRTGGISWVDTKQILKITTAALEPAGIDVAEMAGMLGLDSLDYIVSATGLEGGQIHCRQLIATDGKTNGILKLAGGRGITNADLSDVPADADLVVTLSIDAPGILQEIRKLAATAGEDPSRAVDDGLSDFELEMGLSLENDLLSAFGDVWTAYNSPSGGGLLFSGLVASVEVRDLEKARQTYGKLMNLIDDELLGVEQRGTRFRGMELKSQIFMGRKIHYVNIVGDDDVPVAPAFCLTKNRLYASLHPQNLKAHLRFASGKGKKFSDRLDHELSIPNGDLLCFSYWDAAATMKLLYAAVPYVGQAILTNLQSKAGVELDSFDLPSARAVLPYLGPHTTAVVRTKDGIYSTSTSALPLPLGAGLSTVVPMLGAVRSSRVIRVEAEAVPDDE